MARYYRQLYQGDQVVPKPATEPLLGQEVARKGPLVAALRAQDRVVTQSRRIHLRSGLAGSTEWLTPNTNPDSNTNDHPPANTPRTVARSRNPLTPGCMLELRAVVAMSGKCQRPATAGEGAPAYRNDPSSNEIRLVSDWTDATGTVSRTHSVPLPPSTRQYGAAPTSDGGQWSELRVVKIPLITPQSLSSVTALRRWSQPVVVTLQLQYVGGARVVDCVVAERPYGIAYEADDTVWVSHVLGQTPGGQAPLIDYPYERLSETSPDGNPRGGTWHAADVAGYQAQRLGPCLVSWTSYDEDDQDVNATEAEPIEVTSSTLVGVPNASLTTYSNDQEGWSLAAGTYAKPDYLNDPDGMPYEGVLPVRLRVYCQGAATGGNSGGVIRFQSSPYEWVEATVASGAAAGWVTAWGHARVGRGPGDHAVGQVFARRTGGSGGIRIWAVEVHHQDRYALPL